MMMRFVAFGWICLAFGGIVNAAESVVYAVRFEQPAYAAVAGKPFTARVVIAPVPPTGLFSCGLQVSLVGGKPGSGNLVGIVSPPALGYHTVRGAGSTHTQTGRTATVKGSVNFDVSPLQPYTDSLLATVTVSGLPAGEYGLTLAAKNELGPTEQIFVAGDGSALDRALRFLASRLSVKAEKSPTGPILLNRQTGLFEQTYRLTNDSEAAVTGQRLYVDLPEGITLWNAWNLHLDPDGRAYVVYTGTLDPEESVVLTLEYEVPGRRLNGVLRPGFMLGEAGLDFAPAPAGPLLASTTGKLLATGHVLVEFLGTAGAEYFIQYSDDQVTWKTVMPSLIGTGAPQQWLDNGPPKTETKPRPAPARMYRVVAAQ